MIVTPMVIDWMFVSGATDEGQGVHAAVEVVLSAAASVLPPLGAALIGAAIVMVYLERYGYARIDGAADETAGGNGDAPGPRSA
ncbi:hypothetical protein [Subtercola lobariae]|uniref:hypothetical protein n=1 Tax=Subtercola lobariae TaxID=1588641 RepID=UPI00166BDC8F|nr:hypothetical protein [Subtercola lobariae]